MWLCPAARARLAGSPFVPVRMVSPGGSLPACGAWCCIAACAWKLGLLSPAAVTGMDRGCEFLQASLPCIHC